MNVIFMGAPDFAVPCLEKLIEKHNVIAVFSQPDKPVGRKQILTPPAVKKCANEHKIDVFQPNSLKDNDIILMCSDGLTNMLEDSEIFHIVKESADIKTAADSLVKKANYNGGKDNISVVLIEP